MLSDKRDVVEVKSSKGYLIASVFMIVTAALGYVLGDVYLKQYTISKASFVCTKIEQVGKNMDDVVCVQYTHQKHQQQAVALNKMASIQ